MQRLVWTTAILAATIAVSVRGDGTINGTAGFEVIKGHPDNIREIYEWNLYLSADGTGWLGERRRLGACQEYGAACTAGYYQIDAPAGWYSIYVTQPLFFARPKVVNDVQIFDGQLVTVDPRLNLDYSCYHMADGDWEWSTTWYQTFIATGTSINRIQFMLAGWNADEIEVTIREDNGGGITSWPQVGPTKYANCGYGDAWTGYRSGQIPTTPHQRYALRLRGIGGSPDSSFGIRRRTEDGNGYALGQAYDASGNPRNIDLHATIFSDNDGTVIPYIDTTPGNVETLAGNSGIWGQTFRATNPALAAVDCFIAGAGTWDVDVIFRILENGPGGNQVGVRKTAQALYQAASCGIVGVSYAPGEIPLTPGNTYYIEMSPAAGSPAFTAYRFADQSQNGYAYGDAYYNGVHQTNVDLEMTIIEYAPWYAAAMRNPSFEDYGGSFDHWRINKLDGKGPDDPPNDNTNPFGIQTTAGTHFAGKVTSWQTLDFTMGQLIEVADYDPARNVTEWTLDALVQMHSRTTSTAYPANVHQVWEIGYNLDGSIPPNADRCDYYETIADLDGNHTANDAESFYSVNVSGMIEAMPGPTHVAIRVHMYNDTARQWSMVNIDDVRFAAVVPPPGPQIGLDPTGLERTVWIGNPLPDDVFTITNTGPGTLNYTITDDVEWLSVSPQTGFSNGEPDTITITYDSTNLPAGSFVGTITLDSEDAWNAPEAFVVNLTIETVTPDFDGDGDVDQVDFGHLQECLSGEGEAQNEEGCQNARLDNDNDVDQDDFGILQNCVSGADVAANPACDVD